MKLQRMAVAAFAITGAGLIPAPAQAQSTQELIETVGAMILADRLGIDPNMILMAKLNGGGSVFDMAPALAMGAYGNGNLGSILAMQNSGYGWNDIADYTSVPQPIYVTLQRTRSLDSDYVWSDELSSRYSVGQDRLYALRRAGYTWHEIAQAMVESQETGQPIEDALYENRIYGVHREPVYADPYAPVYVPPRTSTRYVSVLPAPRYDWRFTSPVFQSQPTLWINNWRTVQPVRRVVTRWSPVRVVQQPLYVLDDGVLRRVQQPVYVMREPAPTRVNRYVRVAPTRFIDTTRRVFVEPTISRYAIRDVSSTSGQRAQRFGEVRREEAWQNQERAHAARDLRAAQREREKDAKKTEQAERFDERRDLNRERQLRQEREVAERREERRKQSDKNSSEAREKRTAQAREKRSEDARAKRREAAQKREKVNQARRKDTKERAEKRRDEKRQQVREKSDKSFARPARAEGKRTKSSPKVRREPRVKASGQQKTELRATKRSDQTRVRAEKRQVRASSSVGLRGSSQAGGPKKGGGSAKKRGKN